MRLETHVAAGAGLSRGGNVFIARHGFSVNYPRQFKKDLAFAIN
jgi:hypothetical protein